MNNNPLGLPTTFGPKVIRTKTIKIKNLPTRISRGKDFKERGKDFEKRVKKHLKDKGYKVSKHHNIHYDIHATKGKKTYYVECKCATARLSPAQVDFKDEVRKKGDVYVIAQKTSTGRIKLKTYK